MADDRLIVFEYHENIVTTILLKKGQEVKDSLDLPQCLLLLTKAMSEGARTGISTAPTSNGVSTLSMIRIGNLYERRSAGPSYIPVSTPNLPPPYDLHGGSKHAPYEPSCARTPPRCARPSSGQPSGRVHVGAHDPLGPKPTPGPRPMWGVPHEPARRKNPNGLIVSSIKDLLVQERLDTLHLAGRHGIIGLLRRLYGNQNVDSVRFIRTFHRMQFYSGRRRYPDSSKLLR